MRCAVSEHSGLGIEAGQPSWLGSLPGAGIEIVAIPDSRVRLARLTEFEQVDAVLLAEGIGSCDAGAGARDGRDFVHDRGDRELVRFARARRLPIVGIGRGAEFLGLYFGGRLRPQPERRPGDGLVNLRVAPWVGPTETSVQPAGHMVCDARKFPTVLAPIAWDRDGNIAGFVHRDEPILGLHWQPAGPDDRAAALIIEELHGGRQIAS